MVRPPEGDDVADGSVSGVPEPAGSDDGSSKANPAAPGRRARRSTQLPTPLDGGDLIGLRRCRGAAVPTRRGWSVSGVGHCREGTRDVLRFPLDRERRDPAVPPPGVPARPGPIELWDLPRKEPVGNSADGPAVRRRPLLAGSAQDLGGRHR